VRHLASVGLQPQSRCHTGPQGFLVEAEETLAGLPRSHVILIDQVQTAPRAPPADRGVSQVPVAAISPAEGILSPSLSETEAGQGRVSEGSADALDRQDGRSGTGSCQCAASVIITNVPPLLQSGQPAHRAPEKSVSSLH